MEEKRVFKSMQEVLDEFLPNHKLCTRCQLPFLSEDLIECLRCKRKYCSYCTKQHKNWVRDGESKWNTRRTNADKLCK